MEGHMDYKTVLVRTNEPYSIIIGEGLLNRCGELISALTPPCRAALISDETVMGLYGPNVKTSLEAAGFSVHSFAFPAGEKSKTPETLLEILDFLASSGFDRSDLVVALGGGVVGDTAGFASAIYMRGMKLVQIPTSLLAMVDSSVGGKTGIDLNSGKNLVGAFKQPKLVICDTQALKTLPEEQFACGMGEIIKYAMISDAELFEFLSKANGKCALSDEILKGIISLCAKIKADIVSADEFDNGERQLLNFGHMIGHAVEKRSGYTLGHGQAVGIGMTMMTEISEELGFCPEGTWKRLVELLVKFGLPHKTDFTARELAETIIMDKKRRGDEITLVMPKKIGACFCKSFKIYEAEELIGLAKGARQ
ncbi:MAG: 3-dehydroquinate synthase [Clostridia bacterium]|nr:3-dehydroquinate synthase [Clostridia bacterium]